MKNVPAQPLRQPLLKARIHHARFRASIITVEPARHAASKSVNGNPARTRPKYAASLKRRSSGALLHAAYAASHGIERWRDARRKSGGIVPQRKIFVPHNLEPAVVEKRIHVVRSEIDQMARHIDPVPSFSERSEIASMPRWVPVSPAFRWAARENVPPADRPPGRRGAPAHGTW